jgi:nucleoside-diphosphate-sugar epimerase
VVGELTDLPDDLNELASFSERNDRMRREGMRNLLEAARAAKAPRFLAESIAWQLPGERGEVVGEMERMVLDAGGVVVRYGRLYGPGTFYESELPDPPRVHLDVAAQRTAALLDAESGVITIVDA